jgi:hypothetical protein
MGEHSEHADTGQGHRNRAEDEEQTPREDQRPHALQDPLLVEPKVEERLFGIDGPERALCESLDSRSGSEVLQRTYWFAAAS